MAERFDPKNLSALLKRSGSFRSVEFVEHWHETNQAVFEVRLARQLRKEFLTDVKALLNGRGNDYADNEVEALVEGLVLARWTLGMRFTVELPPDYSYDAFSERPTAPTHASLIVTVKRSRGAKKPSGKSSIKNSKNSNSSSASSRSGSGTSEDRAAAVRREEERLRSKRRREAARFAKHAAGEEIRVGNLGYTREEWVAKVERKVWVPSSPEAARVLREMDRVWGKTIHTGADLARHLNKRRSPMLRTLQGRPFTRNMMTDLLRHLEKFRIGKSLRRQPRTTG